MMVAPFFLRHYKFSTTVEMYDVKSKLCESQEETALGGGFQGSSDQQHM